MLLLIGALVLAFALTTALMLEIQSRSGDAARVAVAAERAGDLLVALNAIGTEGQANFAKSASTRTTRIEISDTPHVLQTAPDDRSRDLAARIAANNKGVAYVAVLSSVQTQAMDDPRNAGRNREVIMISVPLENAARWMNFTIREPTTLNTRANQTFLLIALGIMSCSVSGVAWLFLRRLDAPSDPTGPRRQSRRARGSFGPRIRTWPR